MGTRQRGAATAGAAPHDDLWVDSLHHLFLAEVLKVPQLIGV